MFSEQTVIALYTVSNNRRRSAEYTHLVTSASQNLIIEIDLYLKCKDNFQVTWLAKKWEEQH